MTLRLSPLIALVIVACAGGKAASGRTADAVVQIPEASEEQTAAAEKEPPAPPARRTEPPVAIASEEAVPELEPASPWAQPAPWGPGGGGGGPDCDRAADCCLKFTQRVGGADPSLVSMCDTIRQAPGSSCPQLLSSMRSAAPSLGIQCN